jgi:signal recognition particle subunit SEC65
MYCFVDSINNVLKNLELKLYIKAEKDNPNKFKVDYQNSEIAVEENYPKTED